jgi:hypothetical protein
MLLDGGRGASRYADHSRPRFNDTFVYGTLERSMEKRITDGEILRPVVEGIVAVATGGHPAAHSTALLEYGNIRHWA